MSKQPRSRPKPIPKTKKRQAKPKEVKKPKAEKKTKKAVQKKTSQTVKKKVEKIMPSSPPPLAIVSRALGSIVKFRQGRGFSLPELHTVSLDVGRARKLGLRVDVRRSTELSKNVEALKKWYTALKGTSKAVKKTPAPTKTKPVSKARK